MYRKRKVVLAYSGGLDSSVILHWLIKKGYEVIAYEANIGQKKDFKFEREKVLKIGGSKYIVDDLREEFIVDFIFPAIKANAVYEDRYLLGAALSKPLIARKQVEVAKRENADYLAHGSDSRENVQMRLEYNYQIFSPGIEVIAPWRNEEFFNEFKNRYDLIEYTLKNNIPIASRMLDISGLPPVIKTTKEKSWVTDYNLMHYNYEGEELKDIKVRPREDIFEMTISPKNAPDKESEIEIEFLEGCPIKLTNLNGDTPEQTPLKIIKYLNELGSANAIGRVDMVENNIIPIKTRSIYETPAGTILMAAHRDLEGLTMDREVMHLRDSLIPKFAEFVYYGFWHSPEMEALRALFDKTQEYVSGKVRLGLYKGNIIMVGRESPFSLYDQAQSSMEVAGGYDPKKAIGFIKINAIRLINNTLRKRNLNYE